MNDLTSPKVPHSMAAADLRSLSLRQKILLTTDGTVTDLIALYTGETIRVRKIEQETTHGHELPMLEADSRTMLLRRRILLAGESKSYLYAESLFVIERLPATIRRQLLETDEPIGLLWKRERLETYREIIEQKTEDDVQAARYFDDARDATMLSRAYLIFNSGKPFGLITEKFPATYFP